MNTSEMQRLDTAGTVRPDEINADALKSAIGETQFEIAEDLAVMDRIDESPSPEELPDGVSSIKAAPSLRIDALKPERFSNDTEPEHVEVDPVGQLTRKVLGKVAVNHDAVMGATRAHDHEPNSRKLRRERALQRLADNDYQPGSRAHDSVLPRPEDRAMDAVINKAAKLLPKPNPLANIDQPIAKHIQPKL
jgi:hypothetical protein